MREHLARLPVQQRVWQRTGANRRVKEARFALFRLMHGDDLLQAAWPRAPLLAP